MAGAALCRPGFYCFPLSIMISFYDILIDGGLMEMTTISPKYQVVIPRRIRESMKLKPGQKMYVVQYQNRIEFVFYKDIKSMRGFLKGLQTDIVREPDRL